MAMIVGTIVLSLMPGAPIPHALTLGKFDHGFAYFCLTAMSVQALSERYAWVGSTVVFALLGILLELAQGLFTDYRDMSAYDALIDCIGASLGLATGWTPLRDALQWIDSRLP
ncbi:MAG: VanZ family protein [Proteobacteria bacterium]|nr:VanZ family protein [Pseudomonadota bacterium]